VCCCRLAGTRGAQLRQICNDLKKVCQHPFMLPDFEPDRSPLPTAAAGSSSSPGGADKAHSAEQQQQQQAAGGLGAIVSSDAEYLAALIASSGKLQLLDQMLQELRGQGKQVLVLAHAPKVRLRVLLHCWM
jgi:primosomal protein N'